MDVRIGVKNTPKELEVLLADDTDGDAVREHVDKALTDGGTLWLTDRRGRQYGVPVDKVALRRDRFHRRRAAHRLRRLTARPAVAARRAGGAEPVPTTRP